MPIRNNPLQEARKRNLMQISDWIKKGMDPIQVMKQCVLVIGCTRKKALEYLEDLGVEI